MHIILDTNIFMEDFSLSGRKFKLLLDFINRTQSQVIMTQIVWEELLHNYERNILDCKKELYRTLEKCRKLIPQYEQITIDFCEQPSEVVEEFKTLLKNKFGFSEKYIFPYHDHYLSELVSRCIRRQKPFTDKGEEFRDAILWLNVLDIADSNDSKTAVFISGDGHYQGDSNKKQSSKSQEGNRLHSDLIEEASEREVKIVYYNSIDELLKSGSKKVEHIDLEWVISQLKEEKLSEGLVDLLNKCGIENVNNLLDDDLWHSNMEILDASVSDARLDRIENFYTYVLEDGSCSFVVVNAFFKMDGDFDYEKEIAEPDYDLDVDEKGRRIAYPVGYHTRREFFSGTFNSSIRVKIALRIRDESVDEFLIEEWEIFKLAANT